jgi:hypothetical protein
MAYAVLTGTPAPRCVYMVTGCSPLAADGSKICAIKVVRQMVMAGHGRAALGDDHALYGLKEARDFVDAIIARLLISTTIIIEMEPGDQWRHRAIIGAVLATLGVSYDKIETR